MTPSQIQFFEDHGYVTGVPIDDGDAVADLRSSFSELEDKEGRESCEIGLMHRHLGFHFIWDVATRSKILDCVEALIGPDIMLLGTHFFCKYGGTDKFVGWHQDLMQWGLEPSFAVSAWYAVDDSDADNGCLRVIPGSHKQGIIEHGHADRAGNLLGSNQEIPGVDDSSAVDIVLRAGEISIHHGDLIHGSNPNRSGRRRCGVSLRYVRPHAKPSAPPWPAVLVRGEDKWNHFGDWKPSFHEPGST